jgi:hypothetical protein
MISARNGAANVFRVNGSGGVFGVGAFNTSGADYAEMFEWQDGNNLVEDRRGMTVMLKDNGKIRVTKPRDADDAGNILGVVSVNPSVVGDSQWNEWRGRYLRDKFDVRLSNTLYYIANVSSETDILRCGINDVAPDGYTKITNIEFVESPGYDKTKEYKPREKRKEWATVGLIGKLRVLPDQIVNPGWRLLQTYKNPDGDTLEYLVK